MGLARRASLIAAGQGHFSGVTRARSAVRAAHRQPGPSSVPTTLRKRKSAAKIAASGALGAQSDPANVTVVVASQILCAPP